MNSHACILLQSNLNAADATLYLAVPELSIHLAQVLVSSAR